MKKNIASSALSKKIKDSITLLQTMCRGKTVELCYSGGKDSDVILELAKMAGIRFRAIYKNTTIDPPGTIKHCLRNGVEIVRAKETFFHLIQQKGFPTRRARFCCDVLKDKASDGQNLQSVQLTTKSLASAVSMEAKRIMLKSSSRYSTGQIKT